jgi:hypothetical protein
VENGCHPNTTHQPYREMVAIIMSLPHLHLLTGFLRRSDDATTYGHQHPPLQRYNSNAFEDPFSDVLSAYEHPVQQDQNGFAEAPSIDRDNKLLGFSLPNYHYTLLDYALRRTHISLTAQLHGMFFLAESPWANAADAASAPTELTCYRRNLFQITGTITLPRTMQYIMSEQGEQFPILAQELTISATESVEGNPIKIISVPWKTPASSNQTPQVEDKTEKEPPSLPLDLASGQDMDSEFVNFPIAWKRLQFRVATANNGRRKELQQHFVVRLKLMVTLATGARVAVAEVHSGPIIVRGRSPRNFQSRKDFPISAGGNAARKTSHLPPPPTRTSTGDSSNHLGARAEPKSAGHMPQMGFNYDGNDLNVSPDFFNDWKIPGGQTGAMTVVPDTANFAMPSAPVYAQSSPDLSRNPSMSRTPSKPPISLSLTEDEPKKPASPTENTKKQPRLGPARPPSFSLNLISSPDESADLLYEYFPLGLDDWMPPVDAVYRPHVVHHIDLPQDPKERASKNKSKRYFTAEEE